MLQFAIPEKFLFFPYKTKKTREIINRLHCGGIKPAKLKKNEVLPLLRSNNSHEAANKFFPKTSRLDDHFRTIRRKDTYGRVVLDDEKGLVQRKRKTRDSNKGILLKMIFKKFSFLRSGVTGSSSELRQVERSWGLRICCSLGYERIQKSSISRVEKEQASQECRWFVTCILMEVWNLLAFKVSAGTLALQKFNEIVNCQIVIGEIY